MKRPGLLAFGWLACLPLCISANPQNTTIVQEAISNTNALSGHVKVGIENVIAKPVTVELYDSTWHSVIVSTTTDDQGYFSLPKQKGHIFCLRFSAPGLNPLQIRVRVRKGEGHDLTVHLSVAT